MSNTKFLSYPTYPCPEVWKGITAIKQAYRNESGAYFEIMFKTGLNNAQSATVKVYCSCTEDGVEKRRLIETLEALNFTTNRIAVMVPGEEQTRGSVGDPNC